MRQRILPTLAVLALASGAACEKNSPDTATPSVDTPATPADGTAAVDGAEAGTSDPWTAALEGDHRTAEDKARDEFRHPKETLSFFGVTPTSNVLELAPGGLWYTEVIAPLVRDGGSLTISVADPAGPEAYYGTRQSSAFIKRQSDEAEVFGKVKTAVLDMDVKIGDDGKMISRTMKGMNLGAENTMDVVLTFRSSHGWHGMDALPMVYAEVFKVLKPGGVFGVVQHRAPEGADPTESAKKGYLPEAYVIEVAKAAGFELAEKSEINANPKDTKDYEGGVWTLPPSLGLKDKDREKYIAIGESDRMTLKFVKPGA